jgi:hypothetical protein
MISTQYLLSLTRCSLIWGSVLFAVLVLLRVLHCTTMDWLLSCVIWFSFRVFVDMARGNLHEHK